MQRARVQREEDSCFQGENRRQLGLWRSLADNGVCIVGKRRVPPPAEETARQAVKDSGGAAGSIKRLEHKMFVAEIR